MCRIGILVVLRRNVYCKILSLAALVDKPQPQIMCQKPGKKLIPIDKPQLYFVNVVELVEVCSQR